MNKIPYTMTGESITVVLNGKPHTVKEGAANFLALQKALIEKNWAEVEQHLTIPSSLEGWTEGLFTVKNDVVHFEGTPLPREVNERIVQMAAIGEDPRPLMRFFERLQKNPSYRSVQQLYSFLVHKNIPFTPDGCFVAYKGLRSDYRDCHSGQLDNYPGNVHEMPRNKISDDPREACHYGLHVGAWEYANGFSRGALVACKVAPEDVVCIPYDSSAQKMRVCKYKVIQTVTSPIKGFIVNIDEPEEIRNGYQPTHQEPEEDKTRPPETQEEKAWAQRATQTYDVFLTDAGLSKIKVIVVIRNATWMGLKEAKDLVDGDLPALVKSGMTEEQADALQADLEEAGADAEVFVTGQKPEPELQIDNPDEDDTDFGEEDETDDDDDDEDTDELHAETAEETDIPVEPKRDERPLEEKVAEVERNAPADPFAHFAHFAAMPPKDLKSVSIGELRKYASAGLKIKGAYHIEGGKEALVKAIVKARKAQKK